ncbi:Bcr/CflA family multidrug efflux MFS transporter [Acinetobacter thermotolerans]|uniref:Bcr/CflA family multidrug efflux MFS transporter n=1 Tax=Acinetobacter thermotolerans TaxID=3151487 RepID=UPI00325BABA1
MTELQKHPSNILIVLLSALVAFGPLSIDMYLPSLPAIAQDLESNVAAVQKTITIFLIGFSIGMLVYGPLSDRYGRKKLLMIGMLIYVLSTLGCIVTEHIEQLQIFRLLQAIGGASASVLSRALVRDLFTNTEIPKILSLMHIITMIATLIAPLLGAFIVQHFHWTGIFIFLLIYSLACMMWSKFTIHSPAPTHQPIGIIESYKAVLTNRHAWGFMLCNSFSFGGMFAYITASSFVFIHYYNFTPQQYAYLFAFNIFSIIIFTSINSRALRKYSAYQLLKIMAGISCAAGLYLAAITVLKLEAVIFLILGLMVFVGVTGSIGANSIANLLKILPKQAGTTSGLAVSMQFAMGAVLSYIVSLFFVDNHPASMNIVVCVAACLCLLSLLFTRGLKEH